MGITKDSLASYGYNFQIKCLYSLISDKKFLQSMEDAVTSDYFDSPSAKWVVDFVLQYYKKYHTTVTPEALSIEVKKLKADVLQVAIKSDLKEVFNCNIDDIDYVKDEFSNFCRNQKMKDALFKSVDLMHINDFDNIRRIMDDALKAGDPKDVGLLLHRDIETRYRESENILIPFPWETLNEITDGGMPPGALVIIMAGTGAGKSTVACHVALKAAKEGFNVAYYTLELEDKYVGKKIDSIMTGIDMKELKHNRDLIEELNSQIPGKIIVKEFYPGRSTMDNIESHQRHLKNDLEITTDLIVIDYPELLKPRKSRKDALEESNDVYTDIKGYAKETGCRIVAPSQLNRGGMKLDIVEHDGIAGSVGKIFISDFVITISRKREDKLNNTARWHILKSRLGLDGMTYNVSMDLTKNKIEMLGDYDPEESVLKETEVKAKLKEKFMKKSYD